MPKALLDRTLAAHKGAERQLRQTFGPSAHRLQSLQENGVGHDLLTALATLGPLDALLRSLDDERFFGPYREHPFVETSFIYSPLDQSRCTYWHRDWRDRYISKPTDSEFDHALGMFSHFLGFTFALNDDSSFWYVPGSQVRRDTTAEAGFTRHAGRRWTDWDREMTAAHRALDRTVDYDAFIMEYVRSMPGAECVPLQAGDLIVFVTLGWHLGIYSASRERRAVQGVFGSDFFASWCDRYMKMR